MNVPQIPQQEFTDPSVVASALVAMKKAINPGTVEQRIRELTETDVLMFGNISVIAVSEGELLPEKQSTARHAPLVTLHEHPSPDNMLDVPSTTEAPILSVESEPLRSRKLEKSRQS